jgi:DNA-binding Lrp family transcriptional regulator
MQQGLIRRFGAVLDHYKIGFRANALVAWQVQTGNIEHAAKAMAALANISHCYLRKPQPLWPYNLYTMIHAADRRSCRAILKLILQQLGNTIVSTRVLFTVRELKKARFNSNYAERIHGRTKEV